MKVQDKTVLCPLCKEAFHLPDLSKDPVNIIDDENDKGLTLEHVPPKCLEGRKS